MWGLFSFLSFFLNLLFLSRMRLRKFAGHYRLCVASWNCMQVSMAFYDLSVTSSILIIMGFAIILGVCVCELQRFRPCWVRNYLSNLLFIIQRANITLWCLHRRCVWPWQVIQKRAVPRGHADARRAVHGKKRFLAVH